MSWLLISDTEELDAGGSRRVLRERPRCWLTEEDVSVEILTQRPARRRTVNQAEHLGQPEPGDPSLGHGPNDFPIGQPSSGDTVDMDIDTVPPAIESNDSNMLLSYKVDRVLDYMAEQQRRTDDRMMYFAEEIQRLHIRDRQYRETGECARGKDSTSNYLRRCVRQHVSRTFGFGAESFPSPPTELQKSFILACAERGATIPQPYAYDWNSPPSTLYNLVVEDAFCADFWACADGGEYAIEQIPIKYQKMEGFIPLLRRHLLHRRRQWVDEQKEIPLSQRRESARHYARNSRIGTTFRNRRNAATYIPDVDLATKVYRLVDSVGTQGISSDEEVPHPPGQQRQYVVYEKPWRSAALISLYRYLDLLHAATRNPNGNPIRLRHRTGRVRERMHIPRGLPWDCYDAAYINTRPPLEKLALRPKPHCGIDDARARVSAYSIL